uniref:(northern house mosquito) hypothetical protein n=1 Tax=Culex pipiens TaxID=7175 RepID=A0A8D8HBS0_CULPI
MSARNKPPIDIQSTAARRRDPRGTRVQCQRPHQQRMSDVADESLVSHRYGPDQCSRLPPRSYSEGRHPVVADNCCLRANRCSRPVRMGCETVDRRHVAEPEKMVVLVGCKTLPRPDIYLFVINYLGNRVPR